MKILGGALSSGNKGARDLMEIKGSPTSVAYIWSRITLVGFDFSAGEESCVGSNILLARDRHMLKIFVRVPCRFGIFCSGSTSVEDVDAPGRSPWENMPCDYVWSR